MRAGYILLHRQGITLDEWKTPERTLAWIDLLTLTDYETGIVTVSYGFLSKRWRKSKGTVHFWVQHWIAERQIERLTERSTERNAERFFVLNYAKYQKSTEPFTERKGERKTERKGELKKEVSSIKSLALNNKQAEKINASLPNDTVDKIIGSKTDAELETMGEKFREIGMELAGWDEHYAQKTWDQRLNLRTENREKYYQKAYRIVMFYGRKGDRVRALTKKMCYEIAGMVNDLGAMEQTLDDAEIRRREEFSEDQV